MKDFIDFTFDQDNNFYARIHKEGKRRTVRDYEKLKELLLSCREYGYYVKGEAIISKDVDNILNSYEKRMRKKAALTILGDITDKMKLSKIDPTYKKRVVAATLAGVIAITGFVFAKTRPEPDIDTNINTDTTSYYSEYREPDSPASIPVVKYDYEDNVIDIPAQEIQDEIQGIVEEEPVHEENVELNNMLNVATFHYSKEDRSDDPCIISSHRYNDLYEKYSKRYGLDKNLLAAIGAHESYGDHERGCNVGPAEGLMQIEKSVHLGATERAYNFETGEMDEVYVTLEKLQDVETNIQIGAMILQNCLELWDYNIPLAVQTYNLGIGNINKMLSTCAELEGIDREDLKYNPENNAWLNYRAFLQTGDPNYVENVFCFLPDQQQITIEKRSGELASIKLANDYELTNQKSN